MNFISDIELISKTVLDVLGVNNSEVSGWDIVHMYLHVQSKMIMEVPRTVFISGKIQSSAYDDVTRNALSAIEIKFLKGESVDPHLSKHIFNGTLPDHLLADWNIHHLHLSTELDEKDSRFVQRSRNVLFLTISNGTVYFIDVRPHGPKGEPNVFEQKNLLQTIADEMPWVLERYRISDAIGKGEEINDPKEIKRMRKSGVNIFHKINGAIYAPAGGGFVGARFSSKAIRRANELYHLAKDAEKYVVKNRHEIDEQIAQIANYDSSNALFRLSLDNNGIFIYEESTKVGICRLEG